MTAQDYENWTRTLRRHPGQLRALLLCNKLLTGLIYVSYPALLLVLLVTQPMALPRVVLTPAISFILLSLFRDRVNLPRPYEALDIQPLIHKTTKGHSFPSRHVFSVTVIACAFLYLMPWIGIVFLFFAVLMSVIRVLGGVHFPRDVVVGFALGLLSGWIGFVLL
ncbi:MAG: phosphatase PAP2 family protein [Clostridiales bacterium]|nr:phosphatase PAP2 family protein [Clostridiales bacterium]